MFEMMKHCSKKVRKFTPVKTQKTWVFWTIPLTNWKTREARQKPNFSGQRPRNKITACIGRNKLESIPLRRRQELNVKKLDSIETQTQWWFPNYWPRDNSVRLVRRPISVAIDPVNLFQSEQIFEQSRFHSWLKRWNKQAQGEEISGSWTEPISIMFGMMKHCSKKVRKFTPVETQSQACLDNTTDQLKNSRGPSEAQFQWAETQKMH